MSPIQIWRMIRAHRFLILMTVIVCVAIGGLVGKTLPKQSEATTRVMLDSMSPDQVTGQTVTMNKAFIQAQVDIIRDFRVAGAVVDHFGWDKEPGFIAAYKAQSRGNDGGIKRWLAQWVIDSTEVEQTSLTSNILAIRYRSTSAENSRKVVEAIRDAYIQQSLAFRRESAANNSRWHRTQAEKIKKELAVAEARKSDFEKKNGILLQDNNVDAETAKLQAMTGAAAIPPAVASGPIALPPSSMSIQIAQLDQQIATAQQTLGPNHPDLLAMRRAREAAARAAQQETAAARAAALAARAPTGPSISSLINAQTQKVLAQRGLVGEAQRLAGEVAVLRDQLAKTMQQAADFELKSQSTEIGLQPMGNAVAPQAPVTPFFSLFLAGSFVIGLIIGIASAIIIELLNRRIRGVEDLESFEGLPVLGVLPPRKRPSSGFQFPFGRHKTVEAAA